MTQNLSYIWGETEKKSPENDNAELAMREQLDEHANFIIDDSGDVLDFLKRQNLSVKRRRR